MNNKNGVFKMARIEPREFHKNNIRIIVRSAEINDASDLINIVPILDRETDYMLRTEGEFKCTLEEEENIIKRKLENKNDLFLVATINEKIVGTLGLSGNSLYRINHICEFGMGVLKDYWGKGVGNSLIKTMIDWTKENNIRRIELKAVSKNHRAIELYKKFGFEIEGTLKGDHRIGNEYVDSYTMALINK
ncbi:MAG: GNAT family N-acetyltransferase [Anaeromicrobium sp.]|jgi:RimJ/RimL family protein N-acetyltransferase|nr:GNAT family N-acetyltransferase [Anaeromicrobium sp.]